MINKLSLFESNFVGLYLRTWDDVVIVPKNIEDEQASLIQETLGANLIRSGMDPSGMYGVFSVMNSRGLILSDIYGEKKADYDLGNREILYLKDHINAIGNDIVANDHAAMVHEDYANRSVEKISDVLGVETVRGRIGGFNTVGSVSVVTSKGMIVNPETSDDEIEVLKDLFKVPVKLGTSNFGSPMVGSGIVANKNGVLVGEDTTSIELTAIDDVLS
jgi:translation initiation factor eIF-6, putative